MQEKNSKTKQVKILIILILIVLCAGAAFLALRHSRTQSVTRNTKSYRVNETASISGSAKLYHSLTAHHATQAGNRATVKVNRYYLLTTDKAKSKKETTYAQITLNGRQYYVHAAALSLAMSNRINRYVQRLGYPHSKITTAIDGSFGKKGYGTKSGKPRGVIIHDTGTDYSTLNGEVDFMKRDYRHDGIFVHTFINADEIRNIADIKYMAEGAGPKGNPYYVQFEMPHEYSARGFGRQIANSAYYTAYILKKYNLPVTKGTKSGSGTIWTHDMISRYLGGTDHADPVDYWHDTAESYFDSTYNINDFIELVQAYYNRL